MKKLTREEPLMPNATLIFTPEQWSGLDASIKEDLRCYQLNSFSKGGNVCVTVAGYRVSEIEQKCREGGIER
jgi:hypothetical protein